MNQTKVLVIMNKSNNNLTRRKFLGITTTAAGLAMVSWKNGISHASGFQSSGKPDSRFGGVQVGAITYSWRSMPGTPEDIIKYCQQTGISSIELMGDVAEKYAGIPDGKEGSKERREWRLGTPLNKYKELQIGRAHV